MNIVEVSRTFKYNKFKQLNIIYILHINEVYFYFIRSTFIYSNTLYCYSFVVKSAKYLSNKVLKLQVCVH